MNHSNKKITIVLGMARSGTSAITAGLDSLGISLGDRLLPPDSFANEKGYFEDFDLYVLNIDLMTHLNKKWDSLAPITIEQLSASNLDPFRIRAKDLLRNRIEIFDHYGFKDPRMCQLLPFWQPIFDELGLETNYVIAVRHPASVATSLARLNWASFEKAIFLWFNSMVYSTRLVASRPNVVVEYDDMLIAPERNLLRISQALSLTPSPEKMERYISEFLDKKLNNAKLDSIPKNHENIPTFIIECFNIFKKLANDQIKFSDPLVVSFFKEQLDKINEYRPLYDMASKLETDLIRTKESETRQSEQLHSIQGSLEQAKADIRILKEQSDRSGKLKDEEISHLHDSLSVAQAELASIYSSLSWRVTSVFRTLSAYIQGKK